MKNLAKCAAAFFAAFFAVSLLLTSCSHAGSEDCASLRFVMDESIVQKISAEADVRNCPSSSRSISAEEMDGLFFEVNLRGAGKRTKTVPVAKNAEIRFENIPVGSVLYAEAVAYSVDDGKKTVLYEGKSDSVRIEGGENFLAISLRKVSIKIYVSATGSDESGDGTQENPLASIAAAVALMDNENEDYTIFVDGMLGRSFNSEKLCAGQFIAEVEAVETEYWSYKKKSPILAKSITLRGKNPLVGGEAVDGINANFSAETNGKSTPVLLVATSVPVILKNIKLTGGFSKSGEALAVGVSYTDSETENSVSIPANVTIKDGVLIAGNNNDVEHSMSIYNPVVRITNGSTLKMEGGRITDNVAGLGVVSVGKNTTFEMTGGYIGENHSYPYYESDYDYGQTVSTCGVLVAAPAEDSSMAGGTFRISGDAVVDEIYIEKEALVTVAGKFANSSQIQLVPAEYEVGLVVVGTASGSGVSLSDACAKFSLKPPADGSFWCVSDSGALRKGYETSSENLSSLIAALGNNTATSPYEIIITDAASDFSTINASIAAALESAKAYASISFKNVSFTEISGELSSFITKLTIPPSVTEVGFIDLGWNFTAFAVADGNSTFSAADGILYANDGNKIVRYPTAYLETTATIASNITAIADGAFAGCTNIASFNVASGNTSFKAIPTTWASSYSGLCAYLELLYFEADPTLGDAPDFSNQAEWTAWDNQRSLQYGHTSYAPLPVLTSYDGTTLFACPPALKLVTKEELMDKYPYTGEGEGDTYYVVYSPCFSFDSVRPYAFAGCHTMDSLYLSLTSASSSSSTNGYTFYKCDGLNSVELDAGRTISAYTFKDCTSLTSVRFTNSLTWSVKSNAFAGCTALNYLWFMAGESTGASACEAGAYPSTCTVEIDGQVN